ncbi:MAG: hypothetical protein WBE38_10690, partial [Terracidiphilus sp.]
EKATFHGSQKVYVYSENALGLRANARAGNEPDFLQECSVKAVRLSTMFRITQILTSPAGCFARISGAVPQFVCPFWRRAR